MSLCVCECIYVYYVLHAPSNGNLGISGTHTYLCVFVYVLMSIMFCMRHRKGTLAYPTIRYTDMFVCLCVCVLTYVSSFSYVRACVRVYTCACVFVCTAFAVLAYIHTYIQAAVQQHVAHTYIHTHTHTYAQVSAAVQAAVQQHAAQSSNDIARLESKLAALEDENRRLRSQSGSMGVSLCVRVFLYVSVSECVHIQILWSWHYLCVHLRIQCLRSQSGSLGVSLCVCVCFHIQIYVELALVQCVHPSNSLPARM
jgi:hypothetical protein